MWCIDNILRFESLYIIEKNNKSIAWCSLFLKIFVQKRIISKLLLFCGGVGNSCGGVPSPPLQGSLVYRKKQERSASIGTKFFKKENYELLLHVDMHHFVSVAKFVYKTLKFLKVKNEKI